MKILFEYKGQKFKAELSDSPKNVKSAFTFMWDLVYDDDSELFQPYELTDRHSLIKAFSRKVKKNGSSD